MDKASGTRKARLVMIFFCVIIWAFVIVQVSRAELCTENGTPCGSLPASTSCNPGTAGWCYQSYSSQAAAVAAATAQDNVSGCGPLTGYGQAPTGWMPYAGSYTNQTIIRCSVNAQLTHFGFYFVNDTVCGNVAECPDSDGDGINNDVDPYPDDSSAFWWRVVAYQKDSNGDYTWLRIETDRGDFIEYGNQIDTEAYPIQINSGPFKHSSTFSPNDTLNAENVGDATLNPIADPDMQAGVDDGTYNDEVSALDDIVANTKATADNVAGLKESIAGVQGAIVELQKQTADAKGGGGIATGGTVESSTITEGVDASMAKLKTEAENAAAAAGGPPSRNSEGLYTELGEGDVPQIEEGGAITDILEDFYDFNPLLNVFGGLTIEAQGFCSQNITLMGRSVTFSICQWESQLETMGLLVYALSAWYGILIVMGRA